MIAELTDVSSCSIKGSPDNMNWDKCTKSHFTKVYSNKCCELQNFPGFPWDPPMGFSCKHTVCIQTNPIIEFQGNPGKF